MTQIGKHPDTFYRVSLKAIIRDNNGKVLMVKENADDWDLPGGGFDHDLSIEDCLKKELFEEISFRGEIIEMKLLECAYQYLASKEANIFRAIYELKLSNDDFSIGQDAHAMEFIDPSIFKDSKNPYEQVIYRLGSM